MESGARAQSMRGAPVLVATKVLRADLAAGPRYSVRELPAHVRSDALRAPISDLTVPQAIPDDVSAAPAAARLRHK